MALSNNAASREMVVENLSKRDSQLPCSSCCSVDSKYRCPRCDVGSCSLACVKKHKVINSCSGQRDKTKYVVRSEYNEENLLNDYRFLEEASRVADNARRDTKNKYKSLSTRVRKLKYAATRKGIQLKLMPVGFQKRNENTSFFHFKTYAIRWRIKWEFSQANVEYVEAENGPCTVGRIIRPRKVAEYKAIKTLLEKYLDQKSADPVFKQKLKIYLGEEIGVFFRNHSTRHASFFKIDTSLTVKEALQGKVVIEYPTFHVVLSHQFAAYSTSSPCVKRRRLENEDVSNDKDEDSFSEHPQDEMKVELLTLRETSKFGTSEGNGVDKKEECNAEIL